MRKDFELFMHSIREADVEKLNSSSVVLAAKTALDNARSVLEQETALLMFEAFAGFNQSRVNLDNAQSMVENAHALYINALENADELARMRQRNLLRVHYNAQQAMDQTLLLIGV